MEPACPQAGLFRGEGTPAPAGIPLRDGMNRNGAPHRERALGFLTAAHFLDAGIRYLLASLRFDLRRREACSYSAKALPAA